MKLIQCPRCHSDRIDYNAEKQKPRFCLECGYTWRNNSEYLDGNGEDVNIIRVGESLYEVDSSLEIADLQ